LLDKRKLRLEVFRIKDSLRVIINDTVWEISRTPYSSSISRNAKTLAYWDSTFKKPFEAAIDSMMDEVKSTINEFQAYLERQVEEIMKGEDC